MHVPGPASVFPARQLSVDAILSWLFDPGLPILLIILGAVIVRWLAHRAITRITDSLSAPRKRKAAPENPTEPDGGRPATDADADAVEMLRVPTGELPVMRRHARLAARALEGTFINPERQQQRVETIGSVLRSVATVLIIIIAVLMIGDQLGLNMAPILASASVGGVALGFGAQSLVKDFLSGLFMLAEDQYGVGDFIEVGTTAGTVEDVSLRVTRIRDGDGVIWYLRNGEITRLANKSQGWSTATVDIPVSYAESPERVIGVLRQAMAALDADPDWDDTLMEEPKVVGVEGVSGGAMTIRITAKCAPNEHWGAQREIRERALTAMVKADIKPPPSFPTFPGGTA